MDFIVTEAGVHHNNGSRLELITEPGKTAGLISALVNARAANPECLEPEEIRDTVVGYATR
jgi:hypothetical protein